MPSYGFGAGVLWATPLSDASGAAIANPTPVLFGVLQEVSVDISGDVKELYGQNQFAEAVARGKAKIACKAKNGRFNGLLLNSVFFGQTVNSGLVADNYDTTGQAIAATVTIVPPASGTFAKDLGVRNSSGNPMTRVASAPAAGQYAVNESTGVYTFAAGDVGQTCFISYQYTATSTVAKNSTVMNLAMGQTPSFRCDLSLGFNGSYSALTLFSCISTKLSIATKLDDFAIPEFDFSAFANVNGQVLKWATAE
jgi:hypothetical protein